MVRGTSNVIKHFSSILQLYCIILIPASVAPWSVHSFSSHYNNISNNYDRLSVSIPLYSSPASLPLSKSKSNSKRPNNHRYMQLRVLGGCRSPVIHDWTSIGHRKSSTAIFSQPINTEDDDDDDDGDVNVSTIGRSSVQEEKKKSNGKEGFDALGFAGYLAPYALTLLLSIAVTGAFFKFVMMDY